MGCIGSASNRIVQDPTFRIKPIVCGSDSASTVKEPTQVRAIEVDEVDRTPERKQDDFDDPMTLPKCTEKVSDNVKQLLLMGILDRVCQWRLARRT